MSERPTASLLAKLLEMHAYTVHVSIQRRGFRYVLTLVWTVITREGPVVAYRPILGSLN